ncbi:MAG: GtrA family protein [Rhodanobacter sp.]
MTFIRYVLIQLFAYCIDLGGFLLLLKTGALGPLAANVISKLAAGLFAFVAHRRFTFRAHGHGNAHGQAVRYFLLLGINIPLSSGLLLIALHWIGHPTIAKIVADIVGVLFTYSISKAFVFVGANAKQGDFDSRKLDS